MGRECVYWMCNQLTWPMHHYFTGYFIIKNEWFHKYGLLYEQQEGNKIKHKITSLFQKRCCGAHSILIQSHFNPSLKRWRRFLRFFVCHIIQYVHLLAIATNIAHFPSVDSLASFSLLSIRFSSLFAFDWIASEPKATQTLGWWNKVEQQKYIVNTQFLFVW